MDRLPPTTVGGHTTQARLRHSSRQVPSNLLPIGKICGHTSKQREETVLSASGQDEINSSRNSCSRLRKRERHFDNTEVLQPTQQAKLVTWSRHLSPATSLAASSPIEATVSACHIQGWHAPKLAGHRGATVVARSNASMVGQGDHLGTMPDGSHD